MVVSKLLPIINVVEVVEHSAFIALETEWNMLVKASQNEPFYRHEFIRTWIDNFAPKEKLKILTGRDNSGKLVAILPLVIKLESMYRLPVWQLISPTNVYSCRFDLIAETKEVAARAFFFYLLKDRSWDILKITDVPQNGNAWQLYSSAQEADLPTGVYESQKSPYLLLPSSYEELIKHLDSKFRANLRRRLKRLQEKGNVSIERIVGGEQLNSYLQKCFEIEESGWKGRSGSATTQKENTYGFYTQIALIAAKHDYLSLFFLKLDDKPIAFQLGFVYNNVYSLVMTSYDESLKECSPSHLLMEEVLKDSISRGLKEFDFLGCDLEWKKDWTKAFRTHSWFFVFRNNGFGHILHKTKFKLVPVIKQLITYIKKIAVKPK